MSLIETNATAALSIQNTYPIVEYVKAVSIKRLL